MNRIEFDSDEIAASRKWHGGQSSMLYAIASTGALSRGTIRPHVECDCNHGWVSPSEPCRECKGAKMTDAQWLAYLAGKLEAEASADADEARLRAKRAKHGRRSAEAKEMADDAVALDGIAAKCRAAIAQLAA